MLLQRERPRAPRALALSPPRPDRADRALSAVAGALFLASWACAYITFVPPDAPHRAHVARLVDVRR